MKKLFLLIIGLLILVAVPVTVYVAGKSQEIRSKAAAATNLAFSPDTISKNVGDEFSLNITVDPSENQIVAVELHLTYDPDKLEAETITNGALFPNILSSGVIDRGTASITVGAQNSASPVTTSGTAAVIKFKALAKTDAPTSIRFATNTFVGSPGEGANNALQSSKPAEITILDSLAATGGATASGSASLNLTSAGLTSTGSASATNSGNTRDASGSAIALARTTLSPTPTLRLTLTPTPTRSASGSAEASGSALTILTPTDNTSVARDRPTLTGKAPPGSVVTITIHSTPVTVTVTADANGNWSYTPPTPLESGPHSVVASATDPRTGTVENATTSFVVASGTGSSASSSATLTSGANSVPVTGSVETTVTILLLGMLLVIAGFAYPRMIR